MTENKLEKPPIPVDDTPIQPATFQPMSGAAQGRGPLLLKSVFALFFLLCVALVWFLLSARSVSISVIPSHAQVSLSGGFRIFWNRRYLVRPGHYQLRASAPGYYPLEEALTVGDDQAYYRQRMTLKKLPGRVAITSAPLKGAQVYVDRQYRGVTPITLTEVEAGEYTIRLELPRYRTHQQNLTIRGLDTRQSLHVELDPAWALVTLTSHPVGAEVLIDQTSVGQTPLETQILEGERQLTIRQSGYKAWQQLITIQAGQDVELPPVTLEKASGLVMLDTRPQGASVTLNDQYQGQTPIELALDPGQSYSVTLFKAGYKTADHKLVGVSNKKQQLTVDLQPQLGKITVITQPIDAELYLNGQRIVRTEGASRQTLQLPAHKHQLTVKKAGFLSSQMELLPRPGVDQNLQITLKTAQQAKWAKIPEWIDSPANSRLKLLRPNDHFTMGASRREPSRRSNEVQRRVQLTRAFYLAVTEVTNQQYRRFDPQHSSSHVQGISLDGDDLPVVQVTWEQAARYCNWLSAQAQLQPVYQIEDNRVIGADTTALGYRLPTEAEWAWATRYRDGKMLKYSWGQSWPPPANAGNYADRAASKLVNRILVNYQDGYPATAPVNALTANHHGIYNLSGNVAEWIHEDYRIHTSLSQQIEKDPAGRVETGQYHPIRGAGWADASKTQLRLSFRDYGQEARNDVGFRIARWVESFDGRGLAK